MRGVPQGAKCSEFNNYWPNFFFDGRDKYVGLNICRINRRLVYMLALGPRKSDSNFLELGGLLDASEHG